MQYMYQPCYGRVPPLNNSNVLLHENSRDYWTEVEKISIVKSLTISSVNGLANGKDISDTFADQYRYLYSGVPSDSEYMSNVVIRIDQSVYNVCQHNLNNAQ